MEFIRQLERDKTSTNKQRLNIVGNLIDASTTTSSSSSNSSSSLVAMTSIRQRKADPPPSPRRTKHPKEEVIRIAIEQEGGHQDDHMELDDLDLHLYLYTPPQPLRMMPDRRYKVFLQGQTSKGTDESACPSGPECACYCIAFSWIAVAFLVRCSCSRCCVCLHSPIIEIVSVHFVSHFWNGNLPN